MSSDRPSQYWKSWDERPGQTGLVQISTNEFPEPLDRPATQLDRRSFLKAAGITAAAAAVAAGCSRAPVEKAIPYLVQPEEIVPGVSYFYASGCGGCAAGCGVLIKTRDGRPVKLEGNPEHPLSQGGLCAIGQASLLELYDSRRLKKPLIQGQPSTWTEVDRRITQELAAIRSTGGAVRFLSGTICSPALNAEIDAFLADLPDARRVTYDALSSSAILDAHEETHGARLLPHYRLDRAEVIVSIDADFLGTWISPVEYTAGYRAGRRLDAQPPKMSFHAQLESRLSLTGTKADQRIVLSPQELSRAAERLARSVAALAGMSLPAGAAEVPSDVLSEELARRLWDARGRSLVISGLQDRRAQVLVNFMNHLLGNYGPVVDLEHPSRQKAGNDRELQQLIDELRAGAVAALFIYGANPVYDLPQGQGLAEEIKRVRLVIGFSDHLDETASGAQFVCPEPHAMESWGDGEPVRGTLTLFQPAIHRLGDTRAALESLRAWRGRPQPAYDTLREFWQSRIFPQQSAEEDFQAFWDRSVEAGFAQLTVAPVSAREFYLPSLAAVSEQPLSAEEFSLVLYPKVGLRDGRHALNPWLQELPDPISKIAWDNYACLSPAAASRLGLEQGNVVRIEVGPPEGQKRSMDLPVCVQPGQHDQMVAVALGYGRLGTERFADAGPKWWFGRPHTGLVGKNAAPLLTYRDGALQYVQPRVRLIKTGEKYALASTQSHHTLTLPKQLPLMGGEPRELMREMTLAELAGGAVASSHHAPQGNGLWPDDHPHTGHRWGMAIDLTACTGCSACVIACQAENNIPVVGKDEVLRHREMHWLRIDRYYAGETDPAVVHQPMLCQQCGNAPCETVCPVLATVHSAEGLNQQIYNRCIGTRYCANNCPYKTRRFNWFDYARNDRLQNLALNPDVTVRSRSVMEKCTFCVQRIEAARIEARRRGVAIADGEIRTACEQSCPAQAIVFGDLNDPESRVSRMARDPRRFAALEEFNFRPAINYLAVVRNHESASGKENHPHG